MFEAGANRWLVSRKLIETLVFETCKKKKKKKKNIVTVYIYSSIE